MTREKALEVANALYAIENFELLADDLEQVIAKHEEQIKKLSGEWDFAITSYKELGEISQMYGNVLVQCSVPADCGGSITVPQRIKVLKIDVTVENGGEVAFESITGHGECILDGCFLGRNCNIYDFKEVRNVTAIDAEITHCGFVYNCAATSFKNCNYVELVNFIETGSKASCVENCGHVCHVVYNRSEELHIENCDVVDNVLSSSADSPPFAIISNAKTVDNVSGFADVTYNNCKYVNPYTCQGYVTQQDAVGKVRILTEDGSFDAIDISEIYNSINSIEEDLRMINEGGDE